MFASSGIGVHLARGIIGFGLFALALVTGSVWIMIPAFIGGLAALRGCPMCWTIGLFETVANSVRARRGKAAVQLCATCQPMTTPAQQ
jgi:hypothetical protein